MNEDLLFDVVDGVAQITLNRPEAYNSLSSAMLEGLGQAYRRCDEDDDIRVVVVTGAASVFCTGADMSGGGSTFDGGAQTVEVDSCPLSMQAWDVRKPVIAACNGHAVGAGLGVAVQADMRVFANEGKYGFLQARRGVVTDFAMEYVLPRLVGFERAFELLVRASRLTGEEAVAWGLAGRSVPLDQVLDTAMAIENPFEQSFFALVHLPYLQPFFDVNKRVSRLAANIPFIQNNLCPLSFVDVPVPSYIDGILGVYELNRVDLLRDVFIWAYQRSAARYSAIRQSLGEPDSFRLKYRQNLASVIQSIIQNKLNKRQAGLAIKQFAEAHIDSRDRSRFIETAETELMSLHAGNIARYRVRRSEFEAWQKAWRPTFDG